MVDERTLLDRRKFWLLPAFLSLDAPIVTISWLAIIAKTVIAPVSFPVCLAAFAAVWSVYLADRLIDIRVCKDWDEATDRLQFGQRYRHFFGLALVVALSTGLVLMMGNFLPAEVVKRGIYVASGVAIYFGLFVAPPCFKKQKVKGKEFGVGLFFAAGIGAAVGFRRESLLLLVTFGLAVTFNCLLIAARDRKEDAANDPGGASQWWPTIERDLSIGGLCLIIASAALMIGFRNSNQIIFGCFALSFLAMTVLHRYSKSLSEANVRAFADFCLLTPLFGIWFV